MKTNILTPMLTTLATAGVVLLAGSRITTGNLSIISLTVSYVAVVILLALAAFDYRVGQRDYSAR